MTGPCQRPECGGEVHTDGWGTPIQCPARRCPHADHRPGPAEPTHLSYEELLPLVAAVRRRETNALAGYGFLLPPFPDCPACGQQPAELFVRNDHPAHFLKDEVGFGFRPCGHTFTADGEDLYRAYEHARREAP